MSKIFPEMYDRPSNGAVAAGGIYWVVCYFMIPFVTQVLAWAFSTDLTAVGGVDIAAYIINFLCMVALFRAYLGESFWNVQLNKAGFVKTVLFTTVLLLLVEVAIWSYGLFADHLFILSAFPISETSVIADTGFVVIGNPLLGTLCMAVMTPVTVSCMFYGTVFAPIACKRPWMAYVVLAASLLVPRLINIWWSDMGSFNWAIYVAQLPIHLVACWSYQKTNTIWAPIASLGISNLLTSLWFVYMAIIGNVYT